MKFSEYEYKRIDVNEVVSKVSDLKEAFINALSANEQIKIIDQYNVIRGHVDTSFSLASIRNSIDTTDEFYEKEMDFINENAPLLENAFNDFSKAMFNSKFKDELIKEYGEYLFKKIELGLKTFDESIIPLLVEENKLTTEYQKKMATLKVPFDGKEYTLVQMSKFNQDINRETRKSAQEAISKVMLDNLDEFDSIYDKLVKVRHEQAIKLGYENYVDLGYAKLGRTDYDSKMVKGYRDQIYNSVVDKAQEIINDQKIRLGYDELKYYDLALSFMTGNPTPKGNREELVNIAKKMYKEMSKETDEFFTFMTEHELMDLDNRPSKAPGGYCTYISDYKSPFIFASFNQTQGDVDVLTHEAGHAFQVYQSKDIKVPEYLWPTLEACEIHSMSMEFFAHPWMGDFFKEDLEKYIYSHISEAITFIPYGATVDEFQHFVYENPTATPYERRMKWREIENKYLPHKDYDGNEYYENGAYWIRQGHIFSSPFYYIDYTLAQVCALQFFIKSIENKEEAWADYVRLCKVGGSKSFIELVKVANLDNPFVDGTIKKVMEKVMIELNKIDAKNL